MPTSSSRARALRIALGIALIAGGLLHGTGYSVVVPLVDGGTHVAYFGYSPSEIMLFTVAAIGAAATWAARDEAA